MAGISLERRGWNNFLYMLVYQPPVQQAFTGSFRWAIWICLDLKTFCLEYSSSLGSDKLVQVCRWLHFNPLIFRTKIVLYYLELKVSLRISTERFYQFIKSLKPILLSGQDLQNVTSLMPLLYFLQDHLYVKCTNELERRWLAKTVQADYIGAL